MNKDEVLGVVKQWITLDDEIKQLQKIIREKKNIKKKATEALVTTMKSNEKKTKEKPGKKRQKKFNLAGDEKRNFGGNLIWRMTKK